MNDRGGEWFHAQRRSQSKTDCNDEASSRCLLRGALGITDARRREELAFQIVALSDKGFRDESSLRAALTKSEGDNDGGQPHLAK